MKKYSPEVALQNFVSGTLVKLKLVERNKTPWLQDIFSFIKRFLP